MERNELLRDEYRYHIAAESPERLVFIDESRLDCKATYQMYGWAEKGQRAMKQARFVRGQRYVTISLIFVNLITY